MSVRASGVKMSPEADAALQTLEQSPEPAARSIARRVHTLRDILLANCLHGEVVLKDRIPRRLAWQFGLRNLYVEDLPAFWRLLYTVAGDEHRRYVVIVAIVDHAAYDRMFASHR